MANPSATDLFRVKLLTPVSGYSSSGVTRPIGGVRLVDRIYSSLALAMNDCVGIAVPVPVMSIDRGFAGNGGITAAALGTAAAAGVTAGASSIL